PDTHIGYIVMCQILKAVSAATSIAYEQLAVMSVLAHDQVSAMLALIGQATSVGRSTGRVIWANEFLGFLIG
ncbi:hypothetical protein LZ30DRAFT_599342, partial [Colletotrichum cereale]